MATNAEVLKVVEKIDEKLDALTESVIVHHAQDEDKCKKLDQLYIDIHGNGKRGMKVEIEQLKAWMGDQEKQTDRREDTRTKIKLLVWGQAITLGGLFVAVMLGLK